MGNYVSRMGNYVIAIPSELGNYMSADRLISHWASVGMPQFRR
jgi:hypothetical protein